MKAVLAAASLLLLATDAYAIARYNPTSMSCARVQATVQSQGAVILRWTGKSGVPRYGRFVADNGFCESGTQAQWSYVPSADRSSCAVYECKYWSPDDDFIWRPGGR